MIKIIYIIVGTLISILLLIKICNRFWSSQPVFHFYNLWYWLFPPGILQSGPVPKTKFYEDSIRCEPYGIVSKKNKFNMLNLLRAHYNINEASRTKRVFESHDVFDFLTGQKRFSHVSLQYDILKSKLIGVLTSRLLCGHLHNKRIFVSFMDLLCIHKKYRDGDFGYKQIYTHYLKSREHGAQPVFMFKSDKRMKLLVPLVNYNTYAFSIKKIIHPNMFLPNNITCHQCSTQNFQVLLAFMGEIQRNFDCFMTPQFSVLNTLISKNLIIPFLIMDNNSPIAVIIYKNGGIRYNNQKVITCIASYCKNGYEEIFRDSLTNTVVLLKKVIKFDIIEIDNTSHSGHLLNKTFKILHKKGKSSKFYYFYNFIYRPFNSPRAFIIE